MATRPTPPTVPEAPSRAAPSTFSALADAFLPIFGLFQTYLEAGLDYDEDLRDQTLAAALANAMSDLDLLAGAGHVVGVNLAGNGLEFVELVPGVVETLQSKQTLSADTEIDFVLATGVDEHIFTFKNVLSDSPTSYLRIALSDDSKATFETIHSMDISDGVGVTRSTTTAYLAKAIATTGGASGSVVLSQLSGGNPIFNKHMTAAASGPVSTVLSGGGYAETTTALTDVRFTASNLGSDLMNSGEIIYSTKTY